MNTIFQQDPDVGYILWIIRDKGDLREKIRFRVPFDGRKPFFSTHVYRKSSMECPYPTTGRLCTCGGCSLEGDAHVVIENGKALMVSGDY